jgi:ABC-type phosphate transport system substrate-binding protein
MISAPLEIEIDLLRKITPELPVERLHGFVVHRTRVAFAVNPSNPVRSARWGMMRRILDGELDNWKHLGGPDAPIRVVLVREGGGVLLSIETQLMRGQRATPRNPVMVELGPQLVEVVAQDPGALGLAQLGEVRRRGLPELVLSVPIEQQLFLVSLDEPTPAMYAVIDAARRVAAGQLD